jgi:hypothetical protein
MGIFDTVKAKIAQGTGDLAYGNKALGQADAMGTGAVKTGLNAVLNNSAVEVGLGAFNQATHLYQNVKGLIGAAKSFLADPYQVVPNPLLGGYSRKETQKMAQLALSKAYAKNNLFLVRLTDYNYPTKHSGLKAFPDDFEADANRMLDLLAMSVSYNPVAITGDTVKLGMLQGDSIQQSERVEVRMTFLDYSNGAIKRYLIAKKNRMVNRDGTANPPESYILMLTIYHLDQTVGTTKVGNKLIGVFDEEKLLKGGQEQSYLVRVSALDIDLNKREDSLQELQVTFTQIDQFMLPFSE